MDALTRQFGYIGLIQWGTLLAPCYKTIAHAYLIKGLYSKMQPMAYNHYTINKFIYRIYYMAFYS